MTKQHEEYIVKNPDGEPLDVVCAKMYEKNGLDYWQEILILNPGISDNGDIIPLNTVVKLPVVNKKRLNKRTELWK